MDCWCISLSVLLSHALNAPDAILGIVWTHAWQLTVYDSAGLLTLRIEHPHQPGWKILQGTFMPLQTGQDMELMRTHVLLGSVSSQAGGSVRQLNLQFRIRCPHCCALDAAFKAHMHSYNHAVLCTAALTDIWLSLCFQYAITCGLEPYVLRHEELQASCSCKNCVGCAAPLHTYWLCFRHAQLLFASCTLYQSLYVHLCSWSYNS